MQREMRMRNQVSMFLVLSLIMMGKKTKSVSCDLISYEKALCGCIHTKMLKSQPHPPNYFTTQLNIGARPRIIKKKTKSESCD
jgi:hypothetical protein